MVAQGNDPGIQLKLTCAGKVDDADSVVQGPALVQSVELSAVSGIG